MITSINPSPKNEKANKIFVISIQWNPLIKMFTTLTIGPNIITAPIKTTINKRNVIKRNGVMINKILKKLNPRVAIIA